MFGKMTFAFAGAMLWYVGDWINFGEKEYGEKYSQALEITKYDYGTLRNAAYVAKRYPLNERRVNLSWRMHADAARFEIGDRKAMFDMAEANDMSANQFREFLHRQYPSAYQLEAKAPPRTFNTWWLRYSATLPKDLSENDEVRHVAKDAWRAAEKVFDKDT
jgi:hypothetical protein